MLMGPFNVASTTVLSWTASLRTKRYRGFYSGKRPTVSMRAAMLLESRVDGPNSWRGFIIVPLFPSSILIDPFMASLQCHKFTKIASVPCEARTTAPNTNV